MVFTVRQKTYLIRLLNNFFSLFHIMALKRQIKHDLSHKMICKYRHFEVYITNKRARSQFNFSGLSIITKNLYHMYHQTGIIRMIR